ncbi:hypothetical protein COCVIDRAFT_20127 [Bipolaris victoriae FI3]|uniref:Fungal calcium binding protein domain-containing protein n=1 Tax=Bipolaris victoriae (strain FI3) TaxID=930091 RepID=W7E4P0_BIPV3|nr:hypothetical protein COCVIDRAFT_20127 [Bipolaris victoriae FI3]
MRDLSLTTRQKERSYSMHFNTVFLYKMLKFNAIGLLAIMTSLTSAIPAEHVSHVVQGEVAVSKLEARQVQYSCQVVRANQLGRCRNAIADLRRRDLRGFDVFACISAGAAFFDSCAAAVAMGGLDSLIDVGCIGTIASIEAGCRGCKAGIEKRDVERAAATIST